MTKEFKDQGGESTPESVEDKASAAYKVAKQEEEGLRKEIDWVLKIEGAEKIEKIWLKQLRFRLDQAERETQRTEGELQKVLDETSRRLYHTKNCPR